MPAIAANLTGNTYGRLTVIERAGSRHNKSLWVCKCRCGNTTEVISICLTRGIQKGNRIGGTKSCGRCYDHDKYPKEYNAWRDMTARCSDTAHKSYSYYGGRGITVCLEWKLDFLNFLGDMGQSPYTNLSLERIDNMKGYSKDNCKWATWSEQMLNRRHHNQHDYPIYFQGKKDSQTEQS